MAHTTISDVVIWAKHIHGDPDLAETIMALEPGGTVRLRIDGVAGAWRKMDDGKDGRPTKGLRPIGNAQSFWRGLYQGRRGEVVVIELDESTGRAIPLAPSPASPLEREAAIEAVMGLAGQGWRSSEPYGSRDDLYDR